MATQLETALTTPAGDPISHRIKVLRGMRTLLDSDLAELYGVPTSHVNRQVKRNLARFPADFMFQLTVEEAHLLTCQNVTSNPDDARGGRRYLPYAFKEQGVAMLSSVLRSDRAVQVNIAIMRVFVRLREYASTYSDLAHRIESLEQRYQEHDEELGNVFDAIRQLLTPDPEPSGRRIGFPNES
jgi:hypothetical protein